MDIRELFGTVPSAHPDAPLVAEYQQAVSGLSMYSETQHPYEVFLWETSIHGTLLAPPYNTFLFTAVVEKLLGTELPSSGYLLLEKYRDAFDFDGDRIRKRKPQTFYRDRYDVWNQFVGRIYTDNGALSQDEIGQMRAFARKVMTFQLSPIVVFRFAAPVTHYLLMGRSSTGNWLGIYTLAVET